VNDFQLTILLLALPLIIWLLFADDEGDDDDMGGGMMVPAYNPTS